jgi:signal transduction histidine kinase
VIAIENARLLSELRESLDNQTASAEILRTIAADPAEAGKALDTIARTTARLFDASGLNIDIIEDGVVRFAASVGETAWRVRSEVEEGPPDPNRVSGTAIIEKRQIHVPDFSDPDARARWPNVALSVAEEGSLAATPLLRRGEAIGAIVAIRKNSRPFTEPELAQLTNFADQAVIAIENARLLEELRTARDAAEQAVDELQEAQASLIHAEKMASLGQLTAGIAHEIKNPLNFVNNFAGLSVELLNELKETAGPAFASLADDEREDVDEVVEMLTGNLEKVAEHGKRADGIVKSMLAHSRGGGGERQSVDLNALVEESLNLAYHGARAQDQNFNITMERDLDPALAPIEVVPQDLTRVFLNLFGNGFYAANKRASESGEMDFHPTLKVSTCGTGDGVEIRIRDNGTGIPAELQEKLFEPFFTTKPTGEGTGLGLSISYEIVTKQHGGTIMVESAPGEFSEFCITIPRRARG